MLTQLANRITTETFYNSSDTNVLEASHIIIDNWQNKSVTIQRPFYTNLCLAGKDNLTQ